MNGSCNKEEENEKLEIEEEASSTNNKMKSSVVLMWGYLPGISQQKSPLFSPSAVHCPYSGDTWMDVCGGGCGFAMAISESGKLITWGSADDQGQSYLTSGKHGVMHQTSDLCIKFPLPINDFATSFVTTIIKDTPEEFSLPTKASITNAAAGWAHCVSITDTGSVYTWGWKECVPGKIDRKMPSGSDVGDASGKQVSVLTDQASLQSPSSKSTGSSVSQPEDKKPGEETTKRRRITAAKQEFESPIPADESLSAPPCLVALDPGVKITAVAAGGRHTLALSDVGQVWGWGYGGEGQLGLGSRIKLVASPHPIPCTEICSNGKEKSLVLHEGGTNSATQSPKVFGSYIKAIACGGRHSAVITDAGVLLTFGWGLYGQCGQGNTNDVLRPSCVTSMSGIKIEAVAAGLWHTVCICADGRVQAFGGNQFGQLGLGTGAGQAETVPRFLDAPLLGNIIAKMVSCGARHSAILTEDGKIFCWGWNKYGQLGLGDTSDRSTPSEVPLADFLPKTIACGWWHTLSLADIPASI